MTATTTTVRHPTTVSFDSDGVRLEGLLYQPDGPGPHPVIVLAGGWCYVKELAQPTYAEAFLAQGFGALIFDYKTFGGSDGLPRQHIDPNSQLSDYRNAVSFLETVEWVDSNRIGAWGISYSGGHVLILGALDERIKAVCGVVPVVDGYQNMRLAHGTVGFRRLNAALLDSRRRQYMHGEQVYIDHQPRAEGELATWPFPKSRETFAELKERTAPAYEGRSTALSTELLLQYSVAPFLGRLGGKPTKLVLAQGDDHTHWDLAMDAFNEIPGDAKELTVVPRSNHLTLYTDKAEQQRIAAEIGTFFLNSI